MGQISPDNFHIEEDLGLCLSLSANLNQVDLR